MVRVIEYSSCKQFIISIFNDLSYSQFFAATKSGTNSSANERVQAVLELDCWYDTRAGGVEGVCIA